MSAIGEKRENGIPILMYHSVSKDISVRRHPYFEINTTPEVFESHLRYLRENGYTSIAINELGEYFAGRSINGKPVILTFDDGYADFYREAYPILDKYGFKATVFLATGFIKEQKRALLNGKDMLIWKEILDLRKSGTIFGSHTVNHLILKNMDRTEMELELLRSKVDIEDRLGESLDLFSYPYAFPQENQIFKVAYLDTLKYTGYRFGVTTIIGRVSNSDEYLLLRRLPVNRYDDQAFFQAKLEGRYDWVGKMQMIFRKLHTTWTFLS